MIGEISAEGEDVARYTAESRCDCTKAKEPNIAAVDIHAEIGYRYALCNRIA